MYLIAHLSSSRTAATAVSTTRSFKSKRVGFTSPLIVGKAPFGAVALEGSAHETPHVPTPPGLDTRPTLSLFSVVCTSSTGHPPAPNMTASIKIRRFLSPKLKGRQNPASAPLHTPAASLCGALRKLHQTRIKCRLAEKHNTRRYPSPCSVLPLSSANRRRGDDGDGDPHYSKGSSPT